MSENPSEKDVTSNPFMGAAPARELDVPEPASARLTWSADGERIDYEATAAHLDVVSDAGKLLGRMFSLSYVAVDEEGAADPTRPVTFAFNGGPGSSSVPINFGGIGPRRVATDGCGHVRADAAVEDNPHTVLRDTDVVFLAPGHRLVLRGRRLRARERLWRRRRRGRLRARHLRLARGERPLVQPALSLRRVLRHRPQLRPHAHPGRARRGGHGRGASLRDPRLGAGTAGRGPLLPGHDAHLRRHGPVVWPRGQGRGPRRVVRPRP